MQPVMGDEFEFSLAPRRPPVPKGGRRPTALAPPGASALNARISAATAAAARAASPAAPAAAPAARGGAGGAGGGGDFASQLAGRVRAQALELSERDAELASLRARLSARESEVAQLRAARAAGEDVEFAQLEKAAQLREQLEGAAAAAAEARALARRAAAERDELAAGRASLENVLGVQADDLRTLRAAHADALAARDVAIDRLHAALDGRDGAAQRAERSAAAVADEARAADGLRAELATARGAAARADAAAADADAARGVAEGELARVRAELDRLCADEARWADAGRERWHPDGPGAAAAARARSRLGAPAAERGRAAGAAGAAGAAALVAALRDALVARAVGSDALAAALADAEAVACSCARDWRIEREAGQRTRAELGASARDAQAAAQAAREQASAALAEAASARAELSRAAVLAADLDAAGAQLASSEAACVRERSRADSLDAQLARASEAQRAAELAHETSRRLMLAHARGVAAPAELAAAAEDGGAVAGGGGGGGDGGAHGGGSDEAMSKLLAQRVHAALAQLLRATDDALHALTAAPADASPAEPSLGAAEPQTQPLPSPADAALAVPAAARRLRAAARASSERVRELRARVCSCTERVASLEDLLGAERCARRADLRAADADCRRLHAELAESNAAAHLGAGSGAGAWRYGPSAAGAPQLLRDNSRAHAAGGGYPTHAHALYALQPPPQLVPQLQPQPHSAPQPQQPQQPPYPRPAQPSGWHGGEAWSEHGGAPSPPTWARADQPQPRGAHAHATGEAWHASHAAHTREHAASPGYAALHASLERGGYPSANARDLDATAAAQPAPDERAAHGAAWARAHGEPLPPDGGGRAVPRRVAVPSAPAPAHWRADSVAHGRGARGDEAPWPLRAGTQRADTWHAAYECEEVPLPRRPPSAQPAQQPPLQLSPRSWQERMPAMPSAARPRAGGDETLGPHRRPHHRFHADQLDNAEVAAAVHAAASARAQAEALAERASALAQAAGLRMSAGREGRGEMRGARSPPQPSRASFASPPHKEANTVEEVDARLLQPNSAARSEREQSEAYAESWQRAPAPRSSEPTASLYGGGGGSPYGAASDAWRQVQGDGGGAYGRGYGGGPALMHTP